MNRKGQTTGFKVSDYHREITQVIGRDIFDFILVNNQLPPEDLIKRYAEEGELIENDMVDSRLISASLLGEIAEKDSNDLLFNRSLIRHHSKQLTREIIKIVNYL